MKSDDILSLQREILNRRIFLNPFSNDTLNFSLCEFLISLERRNALLDFDTSNYVRKCRFFLENIENIQPKVAELLKSYRDYLEVETQFTSLETKELDIDEVGIPKLIYPQTLSYIKDTCQAIGREYQDCSILELGPWMGATTNILNKNLKNNKVHVYDQFLWEDWMYSTCRDLDNPNFESFQKGQSFSEKFKTLVNPKDHVTIHECDILNHDYDYITPESVVLLIQDFTDEYESMVSIYNKLRDKLVPGKSIVVSPQFGNLNATGLIRFHAEYKSELIPLHRTRSAMRSFVFKP
ncbi:hypothetical protein JMN32_05540 [Fulvivirga sp. 29W222]|uniref:Uncharacterized protein n=1 Tax=Fulvivirga marina TaxID=2494733 RepID=A0A937FWQ3_9BACT|nr:hypothetical protein [Fulvivirga marina]MBL6445761.1 hypothetical protein [Fulvivirga marina]